MKKNIKMNLKKKDARKVYGQKDAKVKAAKKMYGQ